MPFWEDYCAEKPQILTSINHFFKNSLPCWGLRSLDVMNVWRGGDGLKQTLLISSLELISRTQIVMIACWYNEKFETFTAIVDMEFMDASWNDWTAAKQVRCDGPRLQTIVLVVLVIWSWLLFFSSSRMEVTLLGPSHAPVHIFWCRRTGLSKRPPLFLFFLLFSFLSLSSWQRRMGPTDRLGVYMRVKRLFMSVERHSYILPSCSRVRCGLDAL